jgi:nitrate reductase beta subunit
MLKPNRALAFPISGKISRKWNGGWVRKINGKIEPRQGGKLRSLSNIFANPDLPEIDDYYEPFDFDYSHLQNASESKTPPTARPRSLITGERMEKIEGGPNWEEILGTEFKSVRAMSILIRSRKTCMVNLKTPS